MNLSTTVLNHAFCCGDQLWVFQTESKHKKQLLI